MSDIFTHLKLRLADAIRKLQMGENLSDLSTWRFTIFLESFTFKIHWLKNRSNVKSDNSRDMGWKVLEVWYTVYVVQIHSWFPVACPHHIIIMMASQSARLKETTILFTSDIFIVYITGNLALRWLTQKFGGEPTEKSSNFTQNQ